MTTYKNGFSSTARGKLYRKATLFLRGAALTGATVLVDFAVVCVSCVAILAVGIFIYGKYYKV